MTSINFETNMLIAILPELLLLSLGLVILVYDLVMPKEQHIHLGWITGIGLFLIIGVSLVLARPEAEPRLIWGGMLRQDWLSFTFKILFLFGAAITSLLTRDVDRIGRAGEFYLLLLAATLGMNFLAAASDLIMLYLALETTSIPLYVLAGFLKQDDKSVESGFKYLLFGAVTSAIMLYGLSLLYGFSGTTNIYNLVSGVQQSQVPNLVLLGSLLLILVGFGFKTSIVPMHFWAPDVYEGAPTPVAGFLSTASKAAGFAVLVRVLMTAFPTITPYWGAILAAVATATMTLGNFLALAQKNIKRLLAYSSIAHAGYALIGFVAVSSTLGVTSVVFYLVVYLITNLAAFGIVSVFGRVTGSDDIAAYAGLSRRSPWLALALMVAFLSLAGMPPFGGFIVKFSVFAAAVQANMVWLAVVGVLNSIVGLYYYLTVLKVVYLYRSEDEEKPLPVTRASQLALVVLTAGVILLGIVIAPWFDLSHAAALALAFR